MRELTSKERLSILIQREAGKTLDPMVVEICCGIEEEELPFCVVEGSGSSLELAESAARNSGLGVGLGIDKNGAVALTYNRMPSGQTVFSLEPEQCSVANLRLVGVNAARLVKGSPFKAFLKGKN